MATVSIDFDLLRGEALRKTRKAAGFETASEFAEAAGVSVTCVTLIENDQRTPKIKTALAFHAALQSRGN